MTHENLTTCKNLATRALHVGVALAAFTFCALTSPTARAQSLGAKGDFTIGVERVFGMYSGRIEIERPVNDIVMTPTSFGLAYQRPVMPLANPRVAFDYFIVESLSLGGTLGFDSIDGDDPDEPDFESSALLFNPRVGYALPFNTEWGVWFRGGLTYVSEEFGNDAGTSLTALTGEAMFYFMPTASVGFTGGPILDLGITGEQEAGPDDFDYNARLFGLAFGMFARF